MKKTLSVLIAAMMIAAAQAAPQAAKNNAAPAVAASEPAPAAASQPEAMMPSINSPDRRLPLPPPHTLLPICTAIKCCLQQYRHSNRTGFADQMMTAYLTFKALENGTLRADQMLTVSDAGWKIEGSRMFLNPKVPASVSDLIKGMIVQSGNDAATTLAEAMGGGSVDVFVQQMNEEAKRLGMTKTHFKNPTGLATEGHVSTVGDLAILSAALIHDYPKYYPVFSIKSFKYNNVEQPNRNLLLYRDSSVDGLKAGHSESAGYNLAASSKRNGRRIVSIVVGTESTEARASESGKLLNWALQAFDTPKLYNGGEIISKVKVYKGSSKSVNVGFLEDVYITIPHNAGQNIKPILETVQPVVAPIRKGQSLGKLKIIKDGKVITEKNVVALHSVEEGSWFRRMWDDIVLWFKGLFGSSSK